MKTLLIIGYGSVGKLLYFILSNTIYKKYTKKFNVCILCPEDIKINTTHYKIALTKNNYEKELNAILKPGDVVINVSILVGSIELIKYCIKNSVGYCDTSLELFQDDIYDWHEPTDAKALKKHTLQYLQKKLSKEIEDLNYNSGIFPLWGMNPGAISMFAKKGISELYNIFFGKDSNDYAFMAQQCNIMVMQNSELDTQKYRFEQPENVFLNSWSSYAFIEEAVTDSVQIGASLFEEVNDGTIVYNHQHFYNIRPMDLILESYVPNQTILCYCVPHGESSTLSRYLEVSDDKHKKVNTKLMHKGKNVVYRPSVYYCYSSAEFARKSIMEIRENNYKIQDNLYVLNAAEMNKEGEDICGMLFLGLHPTTGEQYSYWSGSITNNKQIYDISAQNYGNCTGLQVCAGLLTALKLIVVNQMKGIYYPEDIEIFEWNDVIPLFGEIYSDFVKYKVNGFMFKDFIKEVLQ